MPRFHLSATAFCVLLPFLQTGAEKRMLDDSAEQMHKFSVACFKARWFSQAKRTWREVLTYYDENNEQVRSALGYRRSGRLWVLGETLYPDTDKVSASARRKLTKRWDKLCADLAADHKKMSLRLRKEGKDERADWHLERALRFDPNDTEIAELRKLKSFEGYHGSKEEVGTLMRSRLMAQVLEVVKDMDFPVQELSGQRNSTIDNILGSSFGYQGVKSPHFTLWGDIGKAELVEGALWAERALYWCDTIFGGANGMGAHKIKGHHWILFKNKEPWAAFVRGMSRNPQDAEFTIQYASSMGWGQITSSHGRKTMEQVRDHVVRKVAQNYTAVRTHALREGVGHALCGYFFNKTLEFMVARPSSKGTSAGKREIKVLVPDIEKWKDMAEEVAWEKGATPANRLPFLIGNNMTNEDRIKSWSLSLYFFRRNPGFLQALDSTVRRGAKGPAHVDEKFEEQAHVPLGLVEKEWREFLTEPDRLLNNCKRDWGGTEPLLPAWKNLMIAINRRRIEHGQAFFGWRNEFSENLRDLLEVDSARRYILTGQLPDKDKRSENLEKWLATGSEPWLRCLPVGLKTKPAKLLAQWLDLPGYRDLLADPRGQWLNLYSRGNDAFLETRPTGPAGTRLSRIYPERDATKVPRSLLVRELGPSVRQKLIQMKVEKPKKVGYPLSIHFFDKLPAGRGEMTCSVSAEGTKIDGFIHRPEDSQLRVLSAPGMAVFIPLLPLPPNQIITVTWTWRVPGQDQPLGRRDSFRTAR